MSFEEALKTLGIEEYKERIFHSNSHGELFHLLDYIWLAENWPQPKEPEHEFSIVFKKIVDFAQEKWERPESVFQHIPKMLGL